MVNKNSVNWKFSWHNSVYCLNLPKQTEIQCLCLLHQCTRCIIVFTVWTSQNKKTMPLPISSVYTRCMHSCASDNSVYSHLIIVQLRTLWHTKEHGLWYFVVSWLISYFPTPAILWYRFKQGTSMSVSLLPKVLPFCSIHWLDC